LSPENIIFWGDSAGGNLALAIVRHLVEKTGLITGLAATHGVLAALTVTVGISE